MNARHLCARPHLILFWLCLFSPLLSAQQETSLRIAVIDLAKAFEAHPETAKATAQLTKDRNASRDIFKEKSEALKKVLQEHQELIRANKKTEAGEKLKAANDLEKEIATLRTTQQRDLEERFLREKHRILDAIRAAVAKHNADKRYAVVLDKSAESAFGIPAVIDASGTADITDEIIALLKTTKPDEAQ
ncbi:MAG: OmpH family outer membrane protein [Verrucomicrobiae bacterium]|nr:OmpH family outer membrane protein [Verrucomicrobiae bacterium]